MSNDRAVGQQGRIAWIETDQGILYMDDERDGDDQFTHEIPYVWDGKQIKAATEDQIAQAIDAAFRAGQDDVRRQLRELLSGVPEGRTSRAALRKRLFERKT